MFKLILTGNMKKWVCVTSNNEQYEDKLFLLHLIWKE